MNREEINEALRKSFNDILNHKPTGKELIRQKEIEEIARKEKEDYEKKRVAFYNNPLHWSNNKRRRYHLPVLRGNINKHRSKCYPSFCPTARFFCLIEDIIDSVLTDSMKNSEFFGQFVGVKDICAGYKGIYSLENIDIDWTSVLSNRGEYISVNH